MRKYTYRFSCYGEMRDRIKAKEERKAKENAYNPRAAARRV